VLASREHRSPHHISIAKRKRHASSSSCSSSYALDFAVGSPKEKRRSVFPTPPPEDHSFCPPSLDQDNKDDDESLLFPMETPVSPPYIVRRDAVTSVTAGSDADAKTTSDLLKGLGIRVICEDSQASAKHNVAAAAYKDDEDDCTFLFDEEVGVGEAKFQSFLTAELDEESETDDESELESDLDDPLN